MYSAEIRSDMMDRRQRYSNNPVKNKNLKIDVKFDITELDLFCAYILSENHSIRRGNIINLRNLICRYMEMIKKD